GGRRTRRHAGDGRVRRRDRGDHATEVPARVILDLHLHSELSDDSRAPVEAYLKVLQRKRAERPLDGIVLTEHRQFDPARDYRALEDRYGFLILNAAEVETDYGHVLVYGVNPDILARFDFTDVRLPAQTLVTEVARLGSVARGWKVCVIQFVKSERWKVGERDVATRLGVDWWTVGDGFTWDSTDMERTEAVAREGWQVSREKIESGVYGLVVLDEITYP